MNIDEIRKKIQKNIGKRIKVTVYGLRNKIDTFEGPIYKAYPNIFTILYAGDEKSFTYRDIITKDIYIKYF